MVAKGVYMLSGVREVVLDERKDEEEGLWTQTLLARDDDVTGTGLLKQTSVHRGIDLITIYV